MQHNHKQKRTRAPRSFSTTFMLTMNRIVIVTSLLWLANEYLGGSL